MIHLASLWLPIVLAAVFVFIASSLIHMLPLWHRGDYRAIPQEAQVAGVLRPLGLTPGEYMLPWCDPKERKSQEFQQRMVEGPVALVSIVPSGPISMGKPLVLWFVYCLIVGVFVALIAGHGVPYGAAYSHVFKVAGAAAFMGYALALLQNSIWLRRSWVTTLKGCFDGVIYAALTAGTFGWLWPR